MARKNFTGYFLATPDRSEMLLYDVCVPAARIVSQSSHSSDLMRFISFDKKKRLQKEKDNNEKKPDSDMSDVNGTA